MSELHEFRRAQDLSLREAAKLAHISATELSAFEFHTARPDDQQINTLATLYKVTTDEIRAAIPSPEQVAQQNNKLVAGLEAFVAAKQHAKEQGLGRGNGGFSALPCPSCKTGTIRYSVAGSNGHMWAACSTNDCVRFME